jgi:hypothetical protein
MVRGCAGDGNRPRGVPWWSVFAPGSAEDARLLAAARKTCVGCPAIPLIFERFQAGYAIARNPMEGTVMRLAILLLITGWIAAPGMFAQNPGTPAPIAGSPKVELKGKIENLQVARGQGMPQMEVRTEKGVTRVLLGSFRYLIEQNFNPKAGDEVTVKGYKADDYVVAISVTLESEGRTLKLRDEDGRPVWMRGRRGGPPCPSCK